MTNAIRTQINLLRNTKTNLRTAIMEKGVMVYGSDLFSTYPTRISQISDTPGTYEDDLKKLLDGSLTSYTIPDGTERIRYAAFHDYTSLTSVTIPASVTVIGERAFWNCSSLTSITCLSTTPPTIVGMDSAYEDLYPFKNTNNCPIYVPSDSVDAYKAAWTRYASRIQAIKVPVPAMKWTSSDGTQEISINCEDLATAGTLAQADRTAADPDNLITNVKGSAEIKGCVTTIGSRAFQGCTNLASVNIPDSVTTIGGNAFAGCYALASITIPDSVTSIGSSAFMLCPGLTGVTVNATTPPTLGNNSVFNNTNNCPIYVPAASVLAYQTATNWSTYASRIQAIP